jgi:NTP pyrophosphatase (non-canonical NTP hydrolase)
MVRGEIMDFQELHEKNKERCENDFGHKLTDWLPSQWTNAMAGECGEACNLSKKIDRIAFRQGINKPEDRDLFDLKCRLADEIADVVIYADLLASRLNFKLEDIIRKKFNGKSVEIGSIIKLD